MELFTYNYNIKHLMNVGLDTLTRVQCISITDDNIKKLYDNVFIACCQVEKFAKFSGRSEEKKKSIKHQLNFFLF